MTARAAAAGLMIASGVAIVGISAGLTLYLVANPGWLDAQWQSQLSVAPPEARQQLAGVDARWLSKIVVVCGVLGAVEGLISIGLGWLVHRGRRWAIATSIAVTMFRVLLVALCLLAIAASAAMGQPSGGALNLIVTAALAAAFVATWALLAIARRRTTANAAPDAAPRRCRRDVTRSRAPTIRALAPCPSASAAACRRRGRSSGSSSPAGRRA